MNQKSKLYDYWIKIENDSNLAEINLTDKQKVWVFELSGSVAQPDSYDELLTEEFDILCLNLSDSYFEESTFKVACAFVKLLKNPPDTDTLLLFAEIIKIFSIISRIYLPPNRPELPTNENPQGIIQYREQSLYLSAKQILFDVEVFLNSPHRRVNGYFIGIMKQISDVLGEYNNIQPEKALSNLARVASNKSHEAHRVTKQYAISLYEKREWSSIRHAATTITPKVVKKSIVEGRPLTEDNAFNTIYKWLLKYNAQR